MATFGGYFKQILV